MEQSGMGSFVSFHEKIWSEVCSRHKKQTLFSGICAGIRVSLSCIVNEMVHGYNFMLI